MRSGLKISHFSFEYPRKCVFWLVGDSFTLQDTPKGQQHKIQKGL